jgi:diaminopimelate decarboxylase
MGGYAEVVSAMEYELARQVRVAPQQIIFNGPLKREADIARALCSGSIVNLDSFYEVALVAKIAHSVPDRTVTVGVRCNFDIGAATISRFGFGVNQPEFQTALQILREIDNCCVAGLHCHFLTPRRTAESYRPIAVRMLELAETHFGDGGLRYIDLGGGFFSKMSESLRAQFGYPTPTFTEYGAAIAAVFAEHYRDRMGPELILEPGIALTADVMQFVTQIVDRKQVGSRTVALLSGSIYDVKPTLNTRNLPIAVFSQQANPNLGAENPVDLVGYTCMEGDCLYQGFVGNLEPGDYVVFDNVGAYTNVLKPPFINPAAPMLAYGAKPGQFDLIRRRETIDDIFATYLF